MTQAAPQTSALSDAFDVVERLRARLRAVVKGRDDVIDLLIIAMLSDGHVLLEDFPGSGKTTLAKALGESITSETEDGLIVPFRRIQFTPDLLPSDVTGTTVFDPNANKFFFRPGPIFAFVVLADEINRTSPKVQAALLEGMAEKQVTVDNQTRKLDDLFLVIATQNPLDVAGTFPLPNAQLDRFLFKIRMTHIDRASELAVLEGSKARREGTATAALKKVSRDEIISARRTIETHVHVAQTVKECLVDIATKTREEPRILLGASTRALVLSLPAMQARALVKRRDYVSSDDIAALAPLIFAHRIELAAGTESAEQLVKECMGDPLERLSRMTLKRLTELHSTTKVSTLHGNRIPL